MKKHEKKKEYDSDSVEYEVRDILRHRITAQGYLEYEVIWVGYTDSTWMSEVALRNARDILKEYKERAGLPTGKRTKKAKTPSQKEPSRSPSPKVGGRKRAASPDECTVKEAKRTRRNNNNTILPPTISRSSGRNRYRNNKQSITTTTTPSSSRANTSEPLQTPTFSRSSRRSQAGYNITQSNKSAKSSNVKARSARKRRDNAKEYEVEKIVYHVNRPNGPPLYCVKWKGYLETSFMSEKELPNCAESIREYKDYLKKVDIALKFYEEHGDGPKKEFESGNLKTSNTEAEQKKGSGELEMERSLEVERLLDELVIAVQNATTPTLAVNKNLKNVVESNADSVEPEPERDGNPSNAAVSPVSNDKRQKSIDFDTIGESTQGEETKKKASEESEPILPDFAPISRDTEGPEELVIDVVALNDEQNVIESKKK